MADHNLIEKLNDEHIKFLHSPEWSLLKYRYNEYKLRKREYQTNFIRTKDWETVASIQGFIDAIDDIIKLTEGLGKDIKDGTLDVDAALHVIENK